MTDSNNEAIEQTASDAKTVLAKSGKRSANALKDAEAKAEKVARKNDTNEIEDKKPKITSKPTRSKLERRSKNYRKSAELVSKDALALDKAVALIKKTSTVKFDASVELHINLGVDPRHADQNIRDTLVLPAGTGKKVKVAVFSDDAKDTGADIYGVEEITALLDKGISDFDVLIATPTLMAKLGKYAKVLGPRGLMPNPKSGTVTNDITKAVKEAKSGKVEFRVDSSGIIHLSVGKISFNEKNLIENINAVITAVKAAKPSSVKGSYFKTIYLASTMGPSVRVDTSGLN